MASKSRSGRPKGRSPKRSGFLHILNVIFSGLTLTIGILLVLLAASELLVFLIDRIILGNDNYYDWGRAPMIIFLSSIPFFVAYILLNLYRFKFAAFIFKRFRTSKPPDTVETIELD
ncbi:MAG: hypothetical protein JW939_07100 [Candidatus Thermoplasmatota archaeon]|nr:hypothetical protein [Candidatus Thermoplasmatota archaeon]